MRHLFAGDIAIAHRSEGNQSLADRMADLAQAHDAKAPAGDLASKRALAVFPKTLPDMAIRVGNPAQQSDRQADSQVGHIIGEYIGCGCNAYAAAPAFIEVNLVKANAIDCHDAQRWQTSHQLGLDPDFTAGHHRLNMLAVLGNKSVQDRWSRTTDELGSATVAPVRATAKMIASAERG